MAGRSTATPGALVGREHEFDALTRATAHGGTVMVVGPAGIGKSRLVAAFAAVWPGPVAWGRAWEASATTALLPWQQLAGALVAVADPAELELTFGNALAATFPHLPRSEHVAEEVLALAWREYLQYLRTRGDAALLILEDVHRADDETLRLLRALAGAGLPCPLVVTSRPMSELDRSAEREVLRDVEGSSETLALGGLAPTDAAALVRSLAPDSDEVEAAVAIADGIPLHLRELAAALAAGEPARGLPELVERRLTRLEEGSRAALDAACVAGDEIDIDLVAGILEVGSLEAAERLSASVRIGLLESTSSSGAIAVDEGFRFAHDAYRSVVTETLGPTARARLHARAHAHLRRRASTQSTPSTAQLTTLAHHALAGRAVHGHGPALEAAVDAAEVLLAEGAAHSAHRYLDACIDERTGTLDDSLRRRAQLLLGQARVMLHRTDAHPVLDELTAAAVSLDDQDLLAAVAAASIPPASPHSLGAEPDQRTIRRLRELHHRLPEGDPVRGRVAGALCIVDYTPEGIERLPDMVREAEATAEATSDARLAAWATIGDLGGLRHPGVGDAELRRIDAHLGELGDPFSDEYLSLVGIRVSLLWRLGRFEDVKVLIQRLEGLGDRAPASVRWVGLRWRTTLGILEGTYELAEQHLVRGHDAGVAAGRVEDAASYFGLQACMLARDRLDDVSTLVRGWLDTNPGSPLVQALGAWALADQGHDAEALRLVESAAGRLVTSPSIPQYHPALMASMLVAGWNGQAALSQRLLDASRPYWDEWAVLGTGLMVFGPVSLCAAVAASATGDDPLAIDLFDAAEQRAVVDGSPPSVAHVSLERARHLRRRGDPEAAQWFDEAARRFEALGLRRRADRCRVAASRVDVSGRFGDRSVEEISTMLARTEDRRNGGTDAVEAGLRRNGRSWQASFGDRTALVPHRKGMRALVVLIEHPDTPVPCLHLASIVDGHTPGDRSRTPDDHLPDRTGELHDPVADPLALAQIRARARQLASDAETARNRGDEATALAARRELEEIEEHLRTTTRPDGNSRSFAGDRERARTRITKLLRTTLEMLDEHLPELADHLRGSLTTGSACEYRTARWQPVRWTIEP